MHNGRPPYFFWQEHDEPMHRQMHHKSQQICFHPQWAELLQQVRIPRFRCTRDIPKFQNFAKRPRTDSEELNLKLANLWTAPLVLIYLIFYHLLHHFSLFNNLFLLPPNKPKLTNLNHQKMQSFSKIIQDHPETFLLLMILTEKQ